MPHADSGRAGEVATPAGREPEGKAGPMPGTDDDRARSNGAAGLARWLPLAGILALAAIAFALDLHKLLSFKTIGLNYAGLKGFIANNLAGALGLYVLAYVAVVALSLPGALIMTLAGGLLFGWQLGLPATVVGATAGATVLFLVARSSFGEALAAKAGPAVQKLRTGFQDNALSYMLFLRLVPVFPFVVVNLAAAVLGVPLRTYVLGTLVGIIPGTAAYTVAGSGLGSVIEAQNASYQSCLAKAGAGGSASCPYTIDTSALVTRELVIAFALLGLVALIPVALKSWKERNAKA
ncbi:MAG: TVP38/TMEM64 family protein [Hyphomicrobiaceae bacterium]|nr:TVP38/TMEM64 family protein [Hyphomicrobiaceae bacterium]